MGMKIAFAGMGYVGLSLIMLFMQRIVKHIKVAGAPAVTYGVTLDDAELFGSGVTRDPGSFRSVGTLFDQSLEWRADGRCLQGLCL